MRNFFTLLCRTPDIDETALLPLLHGTASKIAHVTYRPDTFGSERSIVRLRVRDKRFWNVSFSKTIFYRLEFQGCTFEQCLFIGATFVDCRFSDCQFVDSNPYRVEFERCYIDPLSFESCVQDRRYANVGTYLYQELLRNSRQQSQSVFVERAYARYRRWDRYRQASSLPQTGVRRVVGRANVFRLWAYDLLWLSGTSLTRLLLTASVVVFSMARLNKWLVANQHASDNIPPPMEAARYVYFAVATFLGFGDLEPNDTIGYIAMTGQLLIGFILFATIASTIFRKISA